MICEWKGSISILDLFKERRPGQALIMTMFVFLKPMLKFLHFICFYLMTSNHTLKILWDQS